VRKRILAILAAVTCLLGGGFAVAQFAAAGTSSSGGPSVLCAKDGSRDLKVFEGCPAGYFQAQLPVSSVYGLAEALAAGGVIADPTPPVKRDVSVAVTVDFDKTRPVAVTGLPAFKAGNPELWGSNAGEIADASADILVRRVATGTTTCPVAVPASDATPSVGSTVRSFCVYPFHLTPTPPALVPDFLAGQKFTLNIWVFAP
jgi:hypothetical protein